VTPTTRRVCAATAAVTAFAVAAGPWLLIVPTGGSLAVLAVVEQIAGRSLW
jgi:hypothetical protein